MGFAKFRGNDVGDLIKSETGNTVLEFCKFRGQIHGDQIRSGGKNLAHFYEGRAKFFI